MNYVDTANIGYFFWYTMAWIFPTIAFVYFTVLYFRRWIKQ